MISKILFFALLVMFTANSFSAIKIWDGGGADAYLATQENWSDNVAPVSGDYLVFAGSTRTSVTNNYDPETTTFKMIVFSNNCTTCSAPFTLSGNEIVLTGAVKDEYPSVPFNKFLPAIGVAQVNSSSITDTLELDVRLPNNSKLGATDAQNHHLTFKGTVTGGGGALQSCDQYRSTLTFEGPVKNFSLVRRANGNALIWLRSSANEFTSSTFTHEMSQGTLKADSLDAYGGDAASIKLGQPAYNTPAWFIMNADLDTRINGNLTVYGPRYNAIAGTFVNAVADTLLTLGGDLYTVTGIESSNPKSNIGTMVSFDGVGNGVFLGNVTTASTWLDKSGAGTWEFAGSSTSGSTGDVTISQGTLIMNGDYASMKKTTVKLGATLAGTGTVNNVTFENGANYQVLANTTGIHPLIITGNMAVAGSAVVTISPEAFANLTPGVEYEIIRYTSRSGIGMFMAGEGLESALLTEKSGSLVLQVAVEVANISWKGDAADNVWDTTTSNWIDSALYSDGSNVTFSDAADEGTTNVTISATVRPLKVTVTGSRNYTFSGAGIAGGAMVEKRSGSSILTLNNTNAYTGVTLIETGALVLNGTIADSGVWIYEGAAFTNTASGRLTGSSSLVINGRANLSGNSDFTGGCIIAVNVTGLPGQTPVLVNNPRALGSGNVTISKGAVTFQSAGGSFGRNRTLTVGASSRTVLYASGVAVAWLGDVEIPNTLLELQPRSGSSWTFGEPGCSTEVRATSTGGLFVRSDGDLHWYSRLKLGGASYDQTDYNVSHFYATSNEWSYLLLKVRGAVCYATNTLAPTKLSMGQIWGEYNFHPWIDLNGYDQRLAELEMLAVSEGSTQTIKSTMPAMLTISNNAATVTARQGGRIEGAVTLRKQGTGGWSFGCRNLSAGDFIVEGGTLTLTASDTLPSASTESRLTILAGAKVAVPEGVNAAVPKFSYGGLRYAAGVYGGEGCTVPGARILPECFAPGAGAITVTRGDGGFIMIIR
ncbi:MAG: hypothetical protein PHO37_11100 [Kiritimatiellae bacterium]|nr:hypothetical protein [Kiritimatiellia bacterium]